MGAQHIVKPPPSSTDSICPLSLAIRFCLFRTAGCCKWSEGRKYIVGKIKKKR